MRIGVYDATLESIEIAGDTVPLWRVSDLEAHVDRAALLGGVNPPEPPYWAHLWSGARVLAEVSSTATGHVIEIGCGLGLPGLAAARRGAHVTFLDREPAPLAFVEASAAASGVAGVARVVGDFTAPPVRGRFDLVLAAEVLYDRAAFGPLAAALAGLIVPGGRVLLADGRRIDTREFYPALAAMGFRWTTRAVQVSEEGFRVQIDFVEAWLP